LPSQDRGRWRKKSPVEKKVQAYKRVRDRFPEKSDSARSEDGEERRGKFEGPPYLSPSSGKVGEEPASAEKKGLRVGKKSQKEVASLPRGRKRDTWGGKGVTVIE